MAEATLRGDVSLRVPAQAGYLHVLRAVVSGVAARQGLGFEEIGDLCLAANEAAGYLLTLAPGADRICLRMRADDDIQLRVWTDRPVHPWPPSSPNSLAWTILSHLVDNVSFETEDDCPAIALLLKPKPAPRFGDPRVWDPRRASGPA